MMACLPDPTHVDRVERDTNTPAEPNHRADARAQIPSTQKCTHAHRPLQQSKHSCLTLTPLVQVCQTLQHTRPAQQRVGPNAASV